jgi:hypothetical protein
MSEEKPTFRVRDRRLFNPDGTPREIEREEEKPAAGASDATSGLSDSSNAGAQSATSSASATSGAPRVQRDDVSPQREAEATTGARADRGSEEQHARGDEERGAHERGARSQAGAEADPTAFANLVMFIASPAAAALGLSEHPDMQPGEVDLPLARHCIDLLLTLREKSHGNLSQREQQIVEGILAELQMQYVSLNTPRRPAAPRGFTGSDITGGR